MVMSMMRTFDFRKTVQDNDDFAYADELSRAKNLGHYNFIKQSLQAIDENRRMFERSRSYISCCCRCG